MTLGLETMLMIPLYFCSESCYQILNEIKKHVPSFSEWFLHNCFKANAKKFLRFLSHFADKSISIKDFITISSNTVIQRFF